MKHYCLACDLRNDESAFQAYDAYHQNVWPEIKTSLERSGILRMEIYRTGCRLFMIIWVADTFNFQKKTEMDESDPIVQKWERLMSDFQQPLPWARAGAKWQLMDRVFNFGTEI